MSTSPHSSASDHAARLMQGGLAIEEGQVRITDGLPIAVAYLAMHCIREHQACMLEERLRGMAARCGGRLIVSMAEVDDMTSAGINALVAVHTHCRDAGGHLVLCSLSRELHRLFRVTHLDRAIAIAETVDAAAQLMAPQRQQSWFARKFGGRKAA